MSNRFSGVAIDIQARRLIAEEFQMYASELREMYPALAQNAQILIRQEADIYERLIYQLNTWCLSAHKEVRLESVVRKSHESPWDFFKDRHFPAWALKRWPAKFKVETIQVAEHHYYVCPHLATEDRQQHIMFMYEGVNGQNRKS